MEAKEIKVKDLTSRDSVQLENGEWVKMKSIGNGFFHNSKLITWSNGLWSCLLNTDKITVLTPYNNKTQWKKQ